MPFTLTEHQTQKFNEAIELLKKGDRRIVLQGSAGCGKTVLAATLVEHLRKDRTINPNYNNGLVYVTAPTNKALAVLKGKIDSPVNFQTIHSALRLKRFIDPKSGHVRFVKEKLSSRRDDFLRAKLCVLDECSMLNMAFVGGKKKEMVDGQEREQFVKGYLEDYTFPIIFIGDEKQLNPVGEQNSPAFHRGWPVVELSEIIRQGPGNPIIDLSRDLDMIFFKMPKVVEGRGFIYDDNKAGLIDDLAEVNGTDEMKYLSWTNIDVDTMNKHVRERRYGLNPKRVEKDETIVFNSPFGSFYTNQEVKVEDVELITEEFRIPTYKSKVDIDRCLIGQTDSIKIRYYKINGRINILHESSDKIFKAIADSLKANCARHAWDWNLWYYFCELFADIKYNHAISVHKSQGSTYETTIINVGNLNFNKNGAEKQRLFYTAVTRASKLVILNNVK